MDTAMSVIKLPEGGDFPIWADSGKRLVERQLAGAGEDLPEKVVLECPAGVTALAGRGNEVLGYTEGSFYASPADLSERTVLMFRKDRVDLPFVRKSIEYRDPDRPSYVSEFSFRAFMELRIDDPVSLGKIIFGAGLADPDAGKDHYTDVIRRIIASGVVKAVSENLLITDEARKNTAAYAETDHLEEEGVPAGEAPEEYVRRALQESIGSAIDSLDAGISLRRLDEPELDVPGELTEYVRRLRSHVPAPGSVGTLRMDDPERSVVMLIPGRQLAKDNYILDLTKDQTAMMVRTSNVPVRHDESPDTPSYVTSVLDVPVLEWSRMGRRAEKDLCVVDSSKPIPCEFMNFEMLVYNDARDDYMSLVVDGTAVAGVPRDPRAASDMVDIAYAQGVRAFTDREMSRLLESVIHGVFASGIRSEAIFGENAMRPLFLGRVKMSTSRRDALGLFDMVSDGLWDCRLSLKELSITLKEVKRPGEGGLLDALELPEYDDSRDPGDELPLIKAEWEVTRGGEEAEKALSYLEERSGYDPLAAVFLSRCYRDGIGVEKDRDKYIDLMYEAARVKMSMMNAMISAAADGKADLILRDSFTFRWKMPVFTEYLRNELDRHPETKHYAHLEDDVFYPLRRAAMMDEAGWKDILRELWERGGETRKYILDYAAFGEDLNDPPAYRELCYELAKDSIGEYIRNRAKQREERDEAIASVAKEISERKDFPSSVTEDSQRRARAWEDKKQEGESAARRGRRSLINTLGDLFMTMEMWALCLTILTIALLYLFRWFRSDAAPDGILWSFVHMITTFGTFAVAALALFMCFEAFFDIGIIGGIIGAVGSVLVVILMGSYPYVFTYTVIGLGILAAATFIKLLIVMKRGY